MPSPMLLFRRAFVSSILVILLPALLLAQAGSAGLAYQVGVDPKAKLFHVCGEVKTGGRLSLQLDWPAWTPGYAVLWNYGQHVVRLDAKTDAGRKLEARRLSENRWVIVNPARALAVKFCCDVRAIDTENDLGFAQAYLDSVGGWYNGAALFPEIDGFRDEPQEVRFALPPAWKVATAMRPLEDGKVYRVSNYDELVDSPVQLGKFLRKDLEVAGVPIVIVVAGRPDADMEQLAEMTRKIAREQFTLMGSPGLDRYLFIYHAATKGAGGLEHRNSVTISLRQEEYNNPDSWLKVVAAHELFHVWNAKRIHSELFDCYDYSRPHRSKQVWFAEGVTAYYTDLTLYRCGLINKEALYKSLADIIDLYENNRAKGRLSWEDISWYIWDEEIRQGLGVWLLPGWMIDLAIRNETDNRFTLDDVMRFLDTWYGEPEKGYPESGLGTICTAVAQRDFNGFFRRYIAGYEPFPYDSLFGAAGLRWNTTTRQVPDLGCELFWSLQRNVTALDVSERGPAWNAGVRSGDIILDLNGFVPKNREEFASARGALKTGDTLRVRFRRGDVESSAAIVVGSRPVLKSTITELDHPSQRQQRILEGILKGTPR